MRHTRGTVGGRAVDKSEAESGGGGGGVGGEIKLCPFSSSRERLALSEASQGNAPLPLHSSYCYPRCSPPPPSLYTETKRDGGRAFPCFPYLPFRILEPSSPSVPPFLGCFVCSLLQRPWQKEKKAQKMKTGMPGRRGSRRREENFENSAYFLCEAADSGASARSNRI